MELPLIIRRLQIPLLFLNNIVALGFKPGPLRIAISLPITLLLISQTLYDKETPYYSDKYSGACGALILVSLYVDWILLASPDREKWHKISYGKKTPDGQEEDVIVPETFAARVVWGLKLAPYLRYTGWSQQVKNIPTQLPHDFPKWLFTMRMTARLAFLYIICDSISAYTVSTPHGAFREHENGKIRVGWDDRPLWYQIAFTWLHIALITVSMEMFYSAINIPAVLFGLASPRDCPSMYGDLRELYTVKKAWSVVWHQNCRRICTAPALFLVRDKLHLRKGSLASRYLQLFLGFFISAVIHSIAGLLCNRTFADDWAFATFMVQPVALSIEYHIINLAKLCGLQRSLVWRLIGYLWVVGWIGFSFRFYMSAQIVRGMWLHQPMGNLLGFGPSISGSRI